MKFGVIAIFAAGCLRAAALPACPAVAAAATQPAAWDTSGNALVAGKSYVFRYVQYTPGDQQGDLSRAVSLFQSITFNNGGTYTINGTEVDSNASQTTPCMFTGTGSYYFSASGFGFLTNPLRPGDAIWGIVSSKNGVFAGSSTENQSGYNDLFIAAPAGSAASPPFRGTYSVAYLNFPDGFVNDTIAAGFQLNPNSQGALGNVNILAYQGNRPAINQTEAVTYDNSTGIPTLMFPTYFGVAISGSELMYSTPDASFIFGGSPTGWDIFAGVQTSSPASGGGPANPLSGAFSFTGLYGQAGIDETISTSGGAVSGAIQTYWGAFDAISGTIIGHQRLLAPFRTPLRSAGYPSQAIGNTYTEKYILGFNSNGGYVDPVTNRQYVIGASGTIRVGFGTSPALGISIALQAPAPSFAGSTSAVSINPEGVVNAASYAPFTSGVSPGELVVIYGLNFTTSANLASPPYPTSLGNVQVMINGVAAQIEYVYPGQIAAIVPPAVTGPYVQVQVVSAGASSNTVWELLNQTTPGVFSQTENGLGDAVALDATANRIWFVNPAQPNQTVSLFLTGLGAVSPASGLVSGQNGVFVPVNTITATIGGVPAAVSYPALSPVGTGLYQIAVTIPAGVSGSVPLAVSGPDSETSKTTICVISCSSH